VSLCPSVVAGEFRQDVVRVAGNRGPGVTVGQVATDFGGHPVTLWKWRRRADIEAFPAPAAGEVPGGGREWVAPFVPVVDRMPCALCWCRGGCAAQG
jgi:hypothetical protein